jgi:ABC-type Fe3+/spermidine/putrescine transport system ATPase subunit
MHAEISNQFELSIRGVSHFYGQKPALRDLSLEVKGSEVLALLGPSGSGKSTLLAVIAGIVKPQSGTVLLNGQNLLALPTAHRGLGMVFQDFALWPHMTVAQNVAFPLRARACAPTEIATRTEKALARVGLESFAARRPHQLSGGQQQRVALARAVVADTELLLLDEPLSALDPATRSAIRSELAEILRRLNLTTIIVTHDREEAFEIADSIAVLVDGELRQHGKAQDVYERPANVTVARFMGTNVMTARVRSDGAAEINEGSSLLELPRPAVEGPAHLAIVPEQVRIAESHSAMKNILRGKLTKVQYRGGEYRVQVEIGGPAFAQTIEARSKQPPREDAVLVHLPVEAIHVIQESPPAAPIAADIQQTAITSSIQFQEETA